MDQTICLLIQLLSSCTETHIQKSRYINQNKNATRKWFIVTKSEIEGHLMSQQRFHLSCYSWYIQVYVNMVIVARLHLIEKIGFEQSVFCYCVVLNKPSCPFIYKCFNLLSVRRKLFQQVMLFKKAAMAHECYSHGDKLFGNKHHQY